MGCGGLAKCTLILFNALLVLIGLVPLIFGIIAVANQTVLQTVIDTIPGTTNLTQIIDLTEIIKSSAIYIIILGAVILVIGFLGFCGACCKVKWMIVLYLIILIVLVLAEVAIIVLAVAFPGSFSSGAKTLILKSLQDKQLIDYNITTSVEAPSDGPSMAWHGLQYGLKCCGANNLSDYYGVTWQKRVSTAIAPLTCCSHTGTTLPPPSTDFSKTCVAIGNVESEYSQQGCFDALLNVIIQSAVVIGIMAGIGALELILIIFSGIRIRDINQQDD